MEDLYNVMLLKLDGQVVSKDLTRLKSCCRKILPANQLENIKTGIELFEALEAIDKLSENNLGFLKVMFNACDLKSLAEYVEYFEENKSLPESITNSSPLDNMITYLTDNLGSDWKFVVRQLDVNETNIKYIVEGNPGNVREQVYQCLTVWKKNGKKKTSKTHLIEVLKRHGRIDLVEGLKNLDAQH